MDQQQTPAQAYQAYFGPAIFEPLSHIVIDRAGPRPGERVLYVACGTGILTRHLARHVTPGGQVVGIDLNPAMLDVARAWQDHTTGTAPNGVPITYQQGDGTDLDLPDGTHDLLTCQQGLQFFPDRAAGVREMRRVLTDGGRVVVAAWEGLDRHPMYASLVDAEEPHLRDLGVPVDRADLEAPFSLGADELDSLLDDAGFTDIDLTAHTVEAHFPDADRFVERMEYAYAGVVPQFVADPAAFAAYLDTISRATKAIVDTHRHGDHIVVPMHATVVTARARR